jgi:hypothetical protein
MFTELENKVLDVIDDSTKTKLSLYLKYIMSDVAAKNDNMIDNDNKLKDLAKKLDAE